MASQSTGAGRSPLLGRRSSISSRLSFAVSQASHEEGIPQEPVRELHIEDEIAEIKRYEVCAKLLRGCWENHVLIRLPGLYNNR